MKIRELACATGNAQKFALGKLAFKRQGIELKQVAIEIDEIQGENPEPIVLDKVRKAYDILKRPVLVSDDSWVIPALNGFPGAYMKSMNHWLSPQDFINLMRDKTDRTIYLDQYLAYMDDTDTKVFKKRIVGTIVNEPRGETGPTIMRVVELEGDGMTIAEAFDAGMANRKGVERDAWKDAAEWFADRE